MKFMPHEYQKFSVQFIKNHPESMLFLDMGLGPQNCNFLDRHPGSDVRQLRGQQGAGYRSLKSMRFCLARGT